jgi:chorismate-pyruvate lyase
VKPNSNLIYPLNEFYEQSGLPLPSATPLEGRDIPEPYRSLLVHERDMTPTLEDVYQRSIQLRVMNYALSGSVLSRQVVLVQGDGARPVAFGAIKIHLEHFPPQARTQVLARKRPLGTVLRMQGIPHAGCPDAYFQVTADAVIDSALHLTGPNLLYGRRNIIVDADQRILAQVVEILPPANGNSHSERDRAQR